MILVACLIRSSRLDSRLDDRGDAMFNGF